METFKEFLIRKNAEASKEKLAYQKELDDYSKSVEKVFKKIKKWLLEYEGMGLLEIKFKEIKTNDDNIVQELELIIANKIIKFTPKGIKSEKIKIQSSLGSATLKLENKKDWIVCVNGYSSFSPPKLTKISFKNLIMEVFFGEDLQTYYYCTDL